MPKKLDLTDNLEKYIIENSEDLTEIQKEILDYNLSLGNQKKLQISISQAQFLQTLIKISKIKKSFRNWKLYRFQCFINGYITT